MDDNQMPLRAIQIANLADLFTASLPEMLRAIDVAPDTPLKIRVQARQMLWILGHELNALAQGPHHRS